MPGRLKQEKNKNKSKHLDNMKISYNLLLKLMQLSSLDHPHLLQKDKSSKTHFFSLLFGSSTVAYFQLWGGWGGGDFYLFVFFVLIQKPEHVSLITQKLPRTHRGSLPLQKRGGQSNRCSCPRTLCQCQTVCCLDTAHWGLVLGFGNTQKVS